MKLISRRIYTNLNDSEILLDLDYWFLDWNDGKDYEEFVLVKKNSKSDKIYRYITDGRLGTVYVHLTIQANKLEVNIYEKVYSALLPFLLFIGASIMSVYWKWETTMLVLGFSIIFMILIFIQFGRYVNKFKGIVGDKMLRTIE